MAPKLKKGKSYSLDAVFLRRFAHILKIIFPALLSRISGLFILLLVVAVGEQVAVYFVGLIPSNFYHVLPAKDWAGFWSTLSESIMYIVLVASIKSAKQYISGILYVHWRESLTLYIHREYFQSANYYQINILRAGNIDNPDQRITQDVERLCNQFSQMAALLLVSPLTIVTYTYFCWKSVGYIGPLVIYGYFVVGSTINKFLMAPVIDYTYKQEKQEGAFRFKHVQIRTNAEAAAFYTAGPVEKIKADKKLSSLLDTQMNLFLSIYLITSEASSVYVVVAIPIFAGLYDNADIASLMSKVSFQCMYLINSFSQLIDLSNQISDIAGYSHRIGELLECTQSLSQQGYDTGYPRSDPPGLEDNLLVNYSDRECLVNSSEEPVEADTSDET
ncbi:ATP-binding cassette sub-family D member 4 [Apostichopus japonicus]|uniref:ATP-binding cassette sub-family D member 4 n=1 Tax=Stichopus japonicus TaxID=307972 RepID=A0A2G8KLM9_STIJA|nr:ATP-binding cassette sub-family D member 4 [Apostichopus japonicus]